jgi:hypothetical protein
MSIPAVGRSPITDRRRGDGVRSVDGRDSVRDEPVAIRPRCRAALGAAIMAVLAGALVGDGAW